MSRVYGWMTGGICLTGFVAWNVSGNPQLVQTIFGNPALLWGLIIAQLGAVMALSWLINRISAMTATFLYLLYAAINRTHAVQHFSGLHGLQHRGSFRWSRLLALRA